MAFSQKPFRSMLYIPGSRVSAMEKARGLSTDAVILDLEDAVLTSEKETARQSVKDIVQSDFGPRSVIVRINTLDTVWGPDDAAAIAGLAVDGVCLPKTEHADDLDALGAITGDMPIWAMIETPLGVLNVARIAAHPKVAGLIIGSNDLLKSMGARSRADRLPMIAALSQCVLAARAYGKVVMDAVYNAYSDTDGLKVEAEQGRDLGFDGKTLVHPKQLDVANAVFSPSADDIHLAQRKIIAFDAAKSQGQGVAVLDGRIVEELHAIEAQNLIDRAKAIAEMERGWHM